MNMGEPIEQQGVSWYFFTPDEKYERHGPFETKEAARAGLRAWLEDHGFRNKSGRPQRRPVEVEEETSGTPEKPEASARRAMEQRAKAKARRT